MARKRSTKQVVFNGAAFRRAWQAKYPERSRAYAARKLGVSGQMFGLYERGTLPSVEMLHTILNEFGLKFDDVVIENRAN